MNINDTLVYSRQPWAKSRPRRQRGPESIHLLEHHLADVGACFEALLEQPTIRQRLARSADWTVWTTRPHHAYPYSPPSTISAK